MQSSTEFACGRSSSIQPVKRRHLSSERTKLLSTLPLTFRTILKAPRCQCNGAAAQRQTAKSFHSACTTKRAPEVGAYMYSQGCDPIRFSSTEIWPGRPSKPESLHLRKLASTNSTTRTSWELFLRSNGRCCSR